ncbi:hypothetical protein ACLB2K_071649 [Fragaria x ananassa]
MATSNSSSSTVNLKLMIDRKRKKVLFAEAGKDFVDFLFTLLSLPVGTVIRLLTKDGMVGCLGKLYNSVENLNDTYMQPNLNKDVLLKPRAPVGGSDNVFLPLLTNNESNAKKFYMCIQSSCVTSYYNNYVSDDPKAICPQCRGLMSNPAKYVTPPATSTGERAGHGAGYVREVATYMTMDDLEVMPMSTISSITLLNNFNVKDVGTLEERVVPLDMDKGLKLLKKSLQSKSGVLTNVFLGRHV